MNQLKEAEIAAIDSKFNQATIEVGKCISSSMFSEAFEYIERSDCDEDKKYILIGKVVNAVCASFNEKALTEASKGSFKGYFTAIDKCLAYLVNFRSRIDQAFAKEMPDVVDNAVAAYRTKILNAAAQSKFTAAKSLWREVSALPSSLYGGTVGSIVGSDSIGRICQGKLQSNERVIVRAKVLSVTREGCLMTAGGEGDMGTLRIGGTYVNANKFFGNTQNLFFLRTRTPLQVVDGDVLSVVAASAGTYSYTDVTDRHRTVRSVSMQLRLD